MAFWQRLAERCADPEVTNEELWLWRRFADCCCCEIVNVDNFKRRFFLGISSRRDVAKAGKAARRSGIQVCQEVMSVWAEYGDAKHSAEKIHNIYKEELGDEEGGDDGVSDDRLSIGKNTIASALQIKRAIMDDPRRLRRFSRLTNTCEIYHHMLSSPTISLGCGVGFSVMCMLCARRTCSSWYWCMSHPNL